MNIFGMRSEVRVCRTRMISKDLFECKVKSPNPRFCSYSISMGESFICNCPERLAFSAKK